MGLDKWQRRGLRSVLREVRVGSEKGFLGPETMSYSVSFLTKDRTGGLRETPEGRNDVIPPEPP